MDIYRIIENEIRGYETGQVQIVPGYRFSQYETIKRIMMFSNKKYTSGNIDSQGNYKYWYDVIGPRVDDEVKNIDFDTKDITLYSDSIKDTTGIFIADLALKEFLKNNEKATELNDAVEEGAGYGNVVWKKIKGDYVKSDPLNTYVINQLARTLDESSVIERAEMTQSELRAMKGAWENVDEVIKNCKSKGISSTKDGNKSEETEVPYYEVYERNGEVSLEQLKKAKGEENISDTDKDKYVLAKIIVAGLEKSGGSDKGKGGSGKYVLFANEIKAMPYKEYHRGKYTGRWWREGLYEILFDVQIRINNCGNQISRALEYGARQNYYSKDSTIYKNILTDLQRGDIIKGEIQRIDMKMDDIGNYIQEWNMLMQLADRLAKTSEIVQGESLPSGTPFRLGALLNQNAGKFYDFLREKLGLAIKSIIQDWTLPELMKDLKKKDVLRLTGDPKYLEKMHKMMVDAWYVKNLATIGPHNQEQAEMLKQGATEQLKAKPELFLKGLKGIFDDVKPRVQVLITGEAVNLAAELENLATFINLEMDPVRRTALIEMAMSKKGIDATMLPKSPPMQAQPQPQGAQSKQPPVQTQSGESKV